MLGVTSVGELFSTAAVPVPVFGETSVGGMMTVGMVGGEVISPSALTSEKPVGKKYLTRFSC
jgi:hypothetical protein